MATSTPRDDQQINDNTKERPRQRLARRGREGIASMGRQRLYLDQTPAARAEQEQREWARARRLSDDEFFLQYRWYKYRLRRPRSPAEREYARAAWRAGERRQVVVVVRRLNDIPHGRDASENDPIIT